MFEHKIVQNENWLNNVNFKSYFALSLFCMTSLNSNNDFSVPCKRQIQILYSLKVWDAILCGLAPTLLQAPWLILMIFSSVYIYSMMCKSMLWTDQSFSKFRSSSDRLCYAACGHGEKVRYQIVIQQTYAISIIHTTINFNHISCSITFYESQKNKILPLKLRTQRCFSFIVKCNRISSIWMS